MDSVYVLFALNAAGNVIVSNCDSGVTELISGRLVVPSGLSAPALVPPVLFETPLPTLTPALTGPTGLLSRKLGSITIPLASWSAMFGSGAATPGKICTVVALGTETPNIFRPNVLSSAA